MNKKVKIVLNIVALILFAILITYITIKYSPTLIKITKNPQEFRNMILSYGSISALIFILFQILQVVISVIPGEVVQVSGGYIYGTFLGTIYSLIGIVLGSIIVFYIARLLGYNLIKEIVPKKQLENFNFVINSQKSEVALFLLFLIPGIPKDILTYIVGISPIKPLRFLILLTIARFPGIFFSSYIGSNLQQKDYTIAIIVSIISTILFIIGILKRNEIINKIEKLLNK
ncbi:TVP38/TMEM64 family protein [Caldicellulosiruptoraceae bacterium PP1]